ncbi:MAG: hypothetical protein OYH77_01255 [Pseudomonadota bacterium]|nr:hypothetical protein [Pseudomonadota bacterium]
MKRVSIAYSSDSDDAFMYLALEEGLVAGADEYRFEFYRGDIQELNECAKRREFDITAISIALYPQIATDYSLLTVGTSVAAEHGPVVIARRDKALPENLNGVRLALPGQDTTVSLVCQRLLRDYQPRHMHFLAIMPAVLAGEVDAGVLIHELQLASGGDDDTKVRVVLDLAQAWRKHFQLPLPLGGNVISNRLPRREQEKLAAVVRDSIAHGLRDRQATLKKALATSNAPINVQQGDDYIDRYVNATTLALDKSAVQSVNFLLKPHVPTYVGKMATGEMASGLSV